MILRVHKHVNSSSSQRRECCFRLKIPHRGCGGHSTWPMPCGSLGHQGPLEKLCDPGDSDLMGRCHQRNSRQWEWALAKPTEKGCWYSAGKGISLWGESGQRFPAPGTGPCERQGHSLQGEGRVGQELGCGCLGPAGLGPQSFRAPWRPSLHFQLARGFLFPFCLSSSCSSRGWQWQVSE